MSSDQKITWAFNTDRGFAEFLFGYLVRQIGAHQHGTVDVQQIADHLRHQNDTAIWLLAKTLEARENAKEF